MLMLPEWIIIKERLENNIDLLGTQFTDDAEYDIFIYHTYLLNYVMKEIYQFEPQSLEKE